MAEQNQPEVVETPEAEVQPSANPRHAVEAEIAARYRAKVEAEEAAVAQPEATTEAPAEPEPEAQEPAKPAMAKVKIEGHEYEVPQEQVDAEGGLEAYQKRAAANLIFQRAKQREDEANKLLAEARKPVEQPKPDDQLTKLVEAIRFETDPQKAKEAIRQLVSETQLTQEQINQAVQAQIAADKAVEKFRADFPEIASDPLLTQMAVNLEQQARQSGNTEPSADLHQKIGKLLKERYVRPTQPLADKQQKKATVTNIPQARARAAAPEAPKEKTVQEIINDERRARKQIV